MLTDVTHAPVRVADVDEALEFYTEKFGFEKRADEEFTPGMRWVTSALEEVPWGVSAMVEDLYGSPDTLIEEH